MHVNCTFSREVFYLMPNKINFFPPFVLDTYVNFYSTNFTMEFHVICQRLSPAAK